MILLTEAVWVPDSSFSEVFFYLASNGGDLRCGDYATSRQAWADGSVLVHPLTKEQRKDHESRNGWLGRPWPSACRPISELASADIQYTLMPCLWTDRHLFNTPSWARVVDSASYMS